jgi:hypothetical protein
MPPSFLGAVIPEKTAMAPPWEKPPRTMRSLGIPAVISLSIKPWKYV